MNTYHTQREAVYEATKGLYVLLSALMAVMFSLAVALNWLG